MTPDCLDITTAVSGIKKKQLAEVRSMANPPAIVKLALESICLLLNEGDTTDWKIIRSILNKDSFIPSIVNFDTLSLTYDAFLDSHTQFRFRLPVICLCLLIRVQFGSDANRLYAMCVSCV